MDYQVCRITRKWKVLLFCGLVMVSSSAFSVKNYFEISASEMKMLPKFCKTGFSRYKLEGQNWMNHLCPGLNALNHASLIYENNATKKFAIIEALSHFSYTLEHTQSTFFHSFVYLKRGEAYELKRDMPKAVLDYQKALQLKPNNIGVHVALIDVYLKLGDQSKARELIEHGLKIKPSSKSLLRRKKKIN